MRKPPCSVYCQSREVPGVCVLGKSGREDFVKQLLEFWVNWAELRPVI